MADKTLPKNSWHYRMFKRVTGTDDTQGIRKCDYWGHVYIGLLLIAFGVALMAACVGVFVDIWYFEDAVSDLGGKVLLTTLFSIVFACGITLALLPTELFAKVEGAIVKASDRIGRALRCDETLTFTD